MELIDKYLPRTEFDSYEDFKENFTITPPERFDFARDVVDYWAGTEPGKEALIYCDDAGAVRRFTFSDISELSRRAARWFLDEGIGKGDRVLLMLRRRWEYWVIATALCRIGAVGVPASVQMTRKDVAYRVNVSGAKMLVALDDPGVMAQVSGLLDECPGLRLIVSAGDAPVAPMRSFTDEFTTREPYEGSCDASNDDELIIYFTSGTTGLPKMAVHNRLYPLGHLITARYMQRARNNGLHLTQADSGWAKFGWGNIYGQWICGSAILGYDPVRFDPASMLRVMATYHPTSVCIPVTMYRFLLRGGLSREHAQGAEWFSTAGEPLSGKVNDEFHAITGHFIHEGFGQSEGTPITCSFQWLEVRPSSMGKPSPLYDVAIVHPDGAVCQKGEEGEVVIRVREKGRQFGLLDHYSVEGKIIDPAPDGIYHTGDAAYEDEDGYYWYVGRMDDMIKSSGYRIGPFEIESVLNTHPGVKESAIVGSPDPDRGQIVCAIISLNPGFLPSDELTRELQEHVKRTTAPYKYPRKIVYIDDLPKTTSGKIIRRSARDMI